jgi:hypothetical protein
MTSGPPAPGWWRASDGRWYPPAPQAFSPNPTLAKKSHRGIWISVAAIVGVVVIGGILGAYWVYREVSSTVSGALGGATLDCPSADDVGQLLGSPVTGPTSGNLLVASGCYYTGDMEVVIASGAKLIADEQISSMIGEGNAANARSRAIDVGDKGQAWASDTKSSAIAVGTDAVVSVEVQAKDSGSIPDKSDAAIAILQKVLH